MTNIAPVYLFTGPEKGQKDAAVSDLLKAGRSLNNGAEPEIHRFYPFETSVDRIVSLLKNGDLFSDYKFVFLNNADEIKKSEIPSLVSYIKDPSRTGTLVLVTDSYQVDSRISAAVGKKNTRVFWELFENQKEDWIRSYFRKEDMSVSADAVEMILDMVNNRTDDLGMVCGRLVSFFRGSGEITEKDVEEFVFHSKEENVFTLFAKMAEKNFSGSIEVLHKISLSGDHNPVQLLSGLLWQYRNLLKLKKLVSEGTAGNNALLEVKIKGKRNQAIYMKALGSYSEDELERIIILISVYDRKAREINRDRWLTLMEMFIHYSVNRKGVVPRPFGA